MIIKKNDNLSVNLYFVCNGVEASRHEHGDLQFDEAVKFDSPEDHTSYTWNPNGTVG